MNKVEQATLILDKTRHIANLLQDGNVCYAAALLAQLHVTPEILDKVFENLRLYVDAEDLSDVKALVDTILE